MFHELDIDTGIELDTLIKAAQAVERWFPKSLPGMVMKAGKTSDLTAI